MKLYKYKSLFALISCIGWLSFTYSAFMGFHFWYLGFVFFFWLSLGILNYRHESSLWLLKNRWARFAKYYVILIASGFVGDYVIAQKLISLWDYRFYSSAFDWFKLYFLIYPVAGLSVIELIYLFASFFKEKVVLIHHSVKGVVINNLERFTDILMILSIFTGLFFRNLIPFVYLQSIILVLLLLWAILSTFRLKYYMRHWTHWVAVIISTTLLSVFLHEIPNTAVHEWKYNSVHLAFNYPILGIQLWVFFGWYLMVLLMLKYWIQMVLLNNRK